MEAVETIAAEPAVRPAPGCGVASMRLAERLGRSADLIEAALATLIEPAGSRSRSLHTPFQAHRQADRSSIALPSQVMAATGKVSGAMSPTRSALIGESRYFALYLWV